MTRTPAVSTPPDRRKPDALAGATKDGVKRYYDPRYQAITVKVLPGDHYVTSNQDEMLLTVLGSCVSACIRDPATGIGGMNHFMLPGSSTGSRWNATNAAMRYGNHAMEVLINDIVSHGCPRERLEIKLFGGGNVIKGSTAIGSDNARFAVQYVRNEGLHVASKDLGGNLPRRIHYFPATGTVKCLLLRRRSDTYLLREEQTYTRRLSTKKVEGSIELFGGEN